LEAVIKPFDRLRARPVLDTGANGIPLIPFVVSLSNHTTATPDRRFLRSL
jgi:hypothetical protein